MCTRRMAASWRESVSCAVRQCWLTYVFGCEENQLWESFQPLGLTLGKHLLAGHNDCIQIRDCPSYVKESSQGERLKGSTWCKSLTWCENGVAIIEANDLPHLL